MKSWSDTLRFNQPLRDLVPNRAGSESVPRPVDEEAIRAAHERGRIEGEKSLGEQLVRQRAEIQQLLEGLVDSLRKAVPQVVADTEQHVVALALEIAKKLVSDLPISGEMVETAVREALSQIEGTTDFQVRLHPVDLGLLEAMGSSLLGPAAEGRPIQFLSSPEVTRGGCLVQTRFGIVDARRETKLELMKRSLLG